MEHHIERIKRMRLDDFINPIIKDVMIWLINIFHSEYTEGEIPYIENELGRFDTEIVKPEYRRKFHKFFHLFKVANESLPIKWDVIGVDKYAITTTDISLDLNKFFTLTNTNSFNFIEKEYAEEIYESLESQLMKHSTYDENVLHMILKLYPLEPIDSIQRLMMIATNYIVEVIEEKFMEIDRDSEIIEYDEENNQIVWTFYTGFEDEFINDEEQNPFGLRLII